MPITYIDEYDDRGLHFYVLRIGPVYFMALANVKEIFKKDYNPSLTIASSLQLENTHIANLIVIKDIYLYIHVCIFLDFHINILTHYSNYEIRAVANGFYINNRIRIIMLKHLYYISL